MRGVIKQFGALTNDKVASVWPGIVGGCSYCIVETGVGSTDRCARLDFTLASLPVAKPMNVICVSFRMEIQF